VAQTPYAELHCHTNFSFLDGASAPDDLVERAVDLGLTGLAVTDHNGLYGAVRFVSAAEAVGIHPVVGLEIELLDPVVADPSGIVIRHADRVAAAQSGRSGPAPGENPAPRSDRRPASAAETHPCPDCPVIGTGQGGSARDRRASARTASRPLARSQVGWRSLCRLISHANMAGTKGMPRFSQALLAEHTEGLVALSGCRDGGAGPPIADGRPGRGPRGRRALRDVVRPRRRAGHERLLHRAVAPPPARRRLARREAAALAEELGLPVVVTNDVHYARPRTASWPTS
jgi:error-prone DNA polymerase